MGKAGRREGEFERSLRQVRRWCEDGLCSDPTFEQMIWDYITDVLEPMGDIDSGEEFCENSKSRTDSY